MWIERWRVFWVEIIPESWRLGLCWNEMLVDLGSIFLVLVLVLVVYSVVGLVVGTVRVVLFMVESVCAVNYLLVLVFVVFVVSFVGVFMFNDFEVVYVVEYSNLVMDCVYIWVVFYVGNEGFLFYIAFVLAGFSVLVVWLALAFVRDSFFYINVVFMVILIFFLVVFMFMVDLFVTFLVVFVDG